MRVAIYSRVSTADQSTTMQLDELRAYCVRRQWQIAEEFTDEGVSGSKESRPALDRMLKAAKRRAFDFERQLIIARTKSGIEAARKRGKIIGRPRVKVNGEHIRSLRAQGLSWDAVSEQIGIARATCQRAVCAALRCVPLPEK